MLDAAGILIHSSNIGMAKIALRLVPESTEKGGTAFKPIRDTLHLLGLGKGPGVFPAGQESHGKVTPLKNWSRVYTLVSLSFGNEIAVTPIQMAAAFGVLANEGLYVPPKLVERMVSPDGREITPPRVPTRRVFSQDTSQKIKEMLVRVVQEGSGKKARIAGISVAGKTGTAEKLPERKEVTSSFIAFAPSEQPALVVLVVVDEPQGAHYASTVAAPHVKALLERGLYHLGVLCKNEEEISLNRES
jgi:cell division protein FtsI (penicillin-binding protein 3)